MKYIFLLLPFFIFSQTIQKNSPELQNSLNKLNNNYKFFDEIPTSSTLYYTDKNELIYIEVNNIIEKSKLIIYSNNDMKYYSNFANIYLQKEYIIVDNYYMIITIKISNDLKQIDVQYMDKITKIL